MDVVLARIGNKIWISNFD